MILLIDNYDSFTYNLYQYIGELYSDIMVVRNDEITVDEIDKMSPEALIISPGPGYPKDAGISIEAIKKFSGKYLSLEYVLGINQSAKPSAEQLFRLMSLCTASQAILKLYPFQQFLRDCQIKYRLHAITP